MSERPTPAALAHARAILKRELRELDARRVRQVEQLRSVVAGRDTHNPAAIDAETAAIDTAQAHLDRAVERFNLAAIACGRLPL